MRQRVDQAVHPVPARDTQFGVLAATGIDRERLPAKRARHCVGEQAAGIHDGAGGHGLVLEPEVEPVRLRHSLEERRSAQQDRIAGFGPAQ
jgi:hypothetical protein